MRVVGVTVTLEPDTALRAQAYEGLSGRRSGSEPKCATLRVESSRLCRSVSGMAISPFLRRIRAMVGNELLLLPSVAVMPWDEQGRLLLVHDIGIDRWTTIGGMIEPGETPRQAALREAEEETGLQMKILGLRDVVGGPGYEVEYPNGDRVAYVSPVFDASIAGGEKRPDGVETSAAKWWSPSEIEETLEINDFTRNLLRDVGVFISDRG
jgi:ADP-ribose pyrophosphatase YjhB (NUDIX family)